MGDVTALSLPNSEVSSGTTDTHLPPLQGRHSLARPLRKSKKPLNRHDLSDAPLSKLAFRIALKLSASLGLVSPAEGQAARSWLPAAVH